MIPRLVQPKSLNSGRVSRRGASRSSTGGQDDARPVTDGKRWVKRPLSDLELPSDRAKLSDRSCTSTRHEGSARHPGRDSSCPPASLTTLRSLIDRRRRKGNRSRHFLFAWHQASHGPVAAVSRDLGGTHCLRGANGPSPLPGGWPTSGSNAANRLWARGGFPGQLPRRQRREEFPLARSFHPDLVLKRDVPVLGPRIPAETLRRYWQMVGSQPEPDAEMPHNSQRSRRQRQYRRPLSRHHGGSSARPSAFTVGYECEEAPCPAHQKSCPRLVDCSIPPHIRDMEISWGIRWWVQAGRECSSRTSSMRCQPPLDLPSIAVRRAQK